VCLCESVCVWRCAAASACIDVGQRLRVEMSKGSAHVLGSSGAYGSLDRRDDR
jgi:hypothetical protein